MPSPRSRGRRRGGCRSRPPRYRTSRRGHRAVPPGRPRPESWRARSGPPPSPPRPPACIGQLPVAAAGTLARPVRGAPDQHGIDGVGIAITVHRERGLLQADTGGHRQSVLRPARPAIGRDRVLPGGSHHVDLVVPAHAEVGAGIPRAAPGARIPHPLEAPGAATKDEAAIQRGAAPAEPGQVHRARAGLDGEVRGARGAARLADRDHLGLEGEPPSRPILRRAAIDDAVLATPVAGHAGLQPRHVELAGGVADDLGRVVRGERIALARDLTGVDPCGRT